MSQPILKLENLRTYFHTDIGVVKAVDDLNVEVKAGQTLGIVGESGSGKSVTSLTVIAAPTGHIARIEEGSRSSLPVKISRTSLQPRCGRSAGPRSP